MRRLLSADFARLKRDKVFWGGVAFMIAMSLFILFMRHRSGSGAYAGLFYLFPIPVLILSAVFSSWFVGVEYGEGTMRNKLVVGHKRRDVYLSKLIVSSITSVLLCFAYIVPTIAIGFPVFGSIAISVVPFVCTLLIGILASVAFGAVLTLLAMLTQHQVRATICAIVGTVVLLAVSFSVFIRLNEPEFYEITTLAGGSTEGAQIETIENDSYLRGAARDAAQFVSDFLPTGQALEISAGTVVNPHLMPIYSLIILVTSTAAGLIFFERKDIH